MRLVIWSSTFSQSWQWISTRETSITVSFVLLYFLSYAWLFNFHWSHSELTYFQHKDSINSAYSITSSGNFWSYPRLTSFSNKQCTYRVCTNIHGRLIGLKLFYNNFVMPLGLMRAEHRQPANGFWFPLGTSFLSPYWNGGCCFISKIFLSTPWNTKNKKNKFVRTPFTLQNCFVSTNSCGCQILPALLERPLA